MEKVADEELEETSKNIDRSAMQDGAKQRQELMPGSVTEPPPMEVGMHWVKEAADDPMQVESVGFIRALVG